ncbi:uncharacterized protein [Panulirus ornatus]|uniref:uncharacterized protein isoform X2 n=1 Tax=Panulirus ornatus TaxID=150431 RepID=UPI003A89B5B9
MRGRKFDIEEYLMQLQCAKSEKKKKHKTSSFSRTRYCIYSQDPVQDDLIWKSVVRGEAASIQRRKNDYASVQTLYQSSYSPSGRSSTQFSTGTRSAGQEEQPAEVDGLRKRSKQYYAHAGRGPPLPTTSNAIIGWRSSLPDLRLERYGTSTS